MNDLLEPMSRLGSPRILVVGDLMLDRYTWGNAERISPEAPVIVLRAEREEVRPGGAASVASLLRALGADVSLAGVMGDDGPSRVLCNLLREEGINLDAVIRDPGRQTTSKERFMARAANRGPHQIMRVDREERRPLEAHLEHTLIDDVLQDLAEYAIILVSDYAKGVCTPTFLTWLIDRANDLGIPILIDPARITDYARYRGATLLTPNREEAEMAANIKILGPEDAISAGESLSNKWHILNVLIKLDSEGLMLLPGGARGRHFPTRTREVCDVTGAGDMVLAVMGLTRASGLDWDVSAQLANLAAGLEVEKLGAAPVTKAELHAEVMKTVQSNRGKQVTLEEMASLAEAYRRAGKRLVFTNGCFDLLHVGHTTYLQEAARMGDVLIVALNSDASVRRLKGPDRPVICHADRAAMLAALSCVDHVLIFEEDTPRALLLRLRPEVLVKGGTYSTTEVVGKEIVEDYGGQVHVTGRINDVSTTEILSSLRKQRQNTVLP